MDKIIFKTERDFDKIHHLPFNREYKVREDLIESMNTSGFIVPIVLLKTALIDGKERLWILDGQHRCITARFLKLEVVGVVIDPKNINTIVDIVLLVASMNSNSKKWDLMNYVQAYNFLNYEEYRRLLQITHNCPYSVTTVSGLLAGHSSTRTGTANRSVVKGTFVIQDEEGTKDALRLASILSKYERVTSRMLIALKRVMSLKKFNEAIFIEKYKSHVNIIRDLRLDDYTDIFSDWVS